MAEASAAISSHLDMMSLKLGAKLPKVPVSPGALHMTMMVW
jgi:hypothetical protein